MVDGALWRRWVFFYISLTAFVVSLLFPFYWMIITTIRPDSELYRPWGSCRVKSRHCDCQSIADTRQL
jgi:multiple sugar transport system permease protein